MYGNVIWVRRTPDGGVIAKEAELIIGRVKEDVLTTG